MKSPAKVWRQQWLYPPQPHVLHGRTDGVLGLIVLPQPLEHK